MRCTALNRLIVWYQLVPVPADLGGVLWHGCHRLGVVRKFFAVKQRIIIFRAYVNYSSQYYMFGFIVSGIVIRIRLLCKLW